KATFLENGFNGCVKADGACAGYGAFGRWLRIRGRVRGTLSGFGQHAVGFRQRYFRPFHLLPGLNQEVLLYILLEIRVDCLERECHRISRDRKSTRLNSSHVKISYAVFCLKKKTW